jgi:hypothetical protein
MKVQIPKYAHSVKDILEKELLYDGKIEKRSG